jgi:hypothetical protein
MTHLRRVADVAEEADEPGAGIVSGIVVASVSCGSADFAVSSCPVTLSLYIW